MPNQHDGAFRIRTPGAQVASGTFLEIVPNRRLVFTWGVKGDASPLPPGSTTVVIELEPHAAGTMLRLTHSALAPEPVVESHREGWERYLERLRTRAEGRDPGSDVDKSRAGSRRQVAANTTGGSRRDS